MKQVEVDDIKEIPDNFTGFAFVKNETYSIKIWLKNGQAHRVNGPAVVRPSDGYEVWYQNGFRHRLDGPAEIYITEEYWISGITYSLEEFNQKTRLVKQQFVKRNTEFKHLTDEQWNDYLNILVLK